MKATVLTRLGWTEQWASELKAWGGERVVPGRVSAEYTKYYQVFLEGGEVNSELSGSGFPAGLSDYRLPVVGDWVVVSKEREGEMPIIKGVLSRRTALVRTLPGVELREQLVAANVDTVFLMFNVAKKICSKTIERYLMLAYKGGVDPIVVLNKSDLCGVEVVRKQVEKVKTVAREITVIVVSMLTGDGLTDLKCLLRDGRTYCLLGESGVGKSTLTNYLMKSKVQRTASVRLKDGSGRHTTTTRRLFLLPEGGVLIDTPGLRFIGVNEHEKVLAALYPDIVELAERCRFRDCLHKTEPGCRVRLALEEGTVPEERYLSYIELVDEIKQVVEKRRRAEWKRKKSRKTCPVRKKR